jgi:ADP-ribosylglycohydrolase
MGHNTTWLWCFVNTENYRDCVLKAVNLGGDTDTIAAVSGGLAGLYYGKEGIPKEWLNTLRGKEQIDLYCERFYTRCISEKTAANVGGLKTILKFIRRNKSGT